MDNVSRIGVGFFAPGFLLEDAGGNQIRLSDFRGNKNLLLFFFHGRKCSFCADWLDELNGLRSRFALKETEILAFSPDQRWTSRRLKEEKKLAFPILNVTPAVIQQYGIQDTQPEGSGLHPSVFLVDKRGIVRLRMVFNHAQRKPDWGVLSCEVDNLN
ncbi:MAG: redoxin domain-containing protein [Candidatus Zixiibacteriota bacterium]